MNSESLEITIIYDNIPNDHRFKPDWGFGCIIDCDRKRILFDTGASAEILQANLNAASILPESIDIVIISHKHSDHQGGAAWVVERSPNVVVYIPKTFSKTLERQLRAHCKNIVIVEENMPISQSDIFSIVLTKNMFIKEISLIVNTQKGAVIISGCSHTGIDKIVGEARKYTGENVYALFGGLHLLNASNRSIAKISQSLKNMNVKKIAPCHCTGDKALMLLRESYGENFMFNGVGMKFRLQ